MAIDKDIIEQVIGQHPARRLDFDTLYQGLMQNVRERYINRVVNGRLELFNYTPMTMYDQNWTLYTLISRGLILHPDRKEVVATPFPKFFNYGEAQVWGADSHAGEITAFEKLDGSLGIVYHHDGQWYCATRGAFDSEQAIWGTRWIRDNVATSLLDVGHTYLFEIIYPENRIVVSYDFQGMVLLSAYCDNGHEYSLSSLKLLKQKISVRKAKIYPFSSLDAFVREAEEIDKNNEGWVVRFANGHRLKIKGSEYCRIHRLISNITPLGVWEIMVNMDDLDVVKKDLPEEHIKDFDAIRSLLEKKVESIQEALKVSVDKARNMTDKDVGLSIQSGSWPDGSSVSELEKKFLFTARNFDLTMEMKAKGKVSAAVYAYIKPKGNLLEGYVPSTAISRFQGEIG